MATTKTLTPTNQTITIDAFQGEKPDHRHVADAEGKLADAVNALNGNISQLGQKTLLATCDAVADFTLADSITNYKFIFVRLGYYNSGYANYGNALIPVSEIPINTDTTYAQRILGYSGTGQIVVDLLFTSGTTVKVVRKENVNVARILGIK